MNLKNLLFVCTFLVFNFNVSQAALTLHYTNKFISYHHFNPGTDLHHQLLLISTDWNNSTDVSNALLASRDSENLLPPFFTDPPLIYPSPLRFTEGGTLGYGLSRDDMTLDFRIYDLFGYEVLKKEFKPNKNGGYKGYNRIQLNKEFFNHKTLATGVYFFVFLHNDEFLGKGKFAVVQ
tara:strand:+ start:2605 stop:3138 length:534 start_codon:yes stop_codon:yes gene_type:complete